MKITHPRAIDHLLSVIRSEAVAGFTTLELRFTEQRRRVDRRLPPMRATFNPRARPPASEVSVRVVNQYQLTFDAVEWFPDAESLASTETALHEVEQELRYWARRHLELKIQLRCEENPSSAAPKLVAPGDAEVYEQATILFSDFTRAAEARR